MMTLKKQTLLLLMLIAAVIAVRFSGIGDVVTLEIVKRNREMLLSFVNERYALSVLVYIASYITVVAWSGRQGTDGQTVKRTSPALRAAQVVEVGDPASGDASRLLDFRDGGGASCAIKPR